MDSATGDDASTINALILEYLNWSGLEDVSDLFSSECRRRGYDIARDVESRCTSRASSRHTTEDFAEELLSHLDSGQGAKFFQAWKGVKEGLRQPSLEVMTLEFYLHVYFATLPLRHGHKQDHPAAMKVFRQFLESCPATVGAVQELLPYYALPYVPDPTQHPTFTQVFQDSWVVELRSRLCAWLGRRQNVNLPVIFSYIRRLRQHANSVGATLLAQESAASAVRSQRTVRRRLQRLNEDYQKLIGVSWELTQALEAAVRGERVDLEATLAACTHRYPELFNLCLTADTSAGPATILLESMQRCERRPGAASHIPALDFERVRSDLGTAPDTHVLLLLQALRHRITRETTGSVRHAVVTSYVRGDVLGVRGGFRSWSRISAALTNPGHQLLAQTGARLINAMTAFNAGRTYLASEEVSRVLLSALKVDQPDPAATDMALAALQKLSIRSEVQAALIHDGCVEWLVETLAKARTLPPYTQEYAAALLMNLTLRTAGRLRCVPLAPSLLPSLTQLLATVPVHVIPYVTGALYSLLSHPTLRQDAFDLGLDTTLTRLSQGGSQEQRRQLEYIVGEIQRDNPPLSPPPSPDPVLDLEEDPEWLEEELDVDDPVKPPPHAPTGEGLLAWRYTLHADDRPMDSERSTDGRQPRSAPAMPWAPLPAITLPRPHTDSVVISHQKTQETRSKWEYPQDAKDRRLVHLSGRSSTLAEGGGGAAGGTAWTKNQGGNSNIWIRGDEETEDWALSLRSGTRTPRLRSIQASPSHVAEEHLHPDLKSDDDREIILTKRETEGYAQENYERKTTLPPYRSVSPTAHQGACSRSIAVGQRKPADMDNDDSSDPTSSSSINQPTAQRKPSLMMTEKKQISLDDHDALVIPRNVPSSSSVEESLPRASGDSQESELNPYELKSSDGRHVPLEEDDGVEGDPFSGIEEIKKKDEEEEEEQQQQQSSNWNPEEVGERRRSTRTTSEKNCNLERDGNAIVDDGPEAEVVVPLDISNTADSPGKLDKEPGTTDYDVEASRLLEQIVGESREIPSATSAPEEDDPLLRSMPERKVSEYKVAFSSRPRIIRTPPGSAAAVAAASASSEGGGGGGRINQRRSSSSATAPNSPPRAVLPPISATNHTYTKAIS